MDGPHAAAAQRLGQPPRTAAHQPSTKDEFPSLSHRSTRPSEGVCPVYLYYCVCQLPGQSAHTTLVVPGRCLSRRACAPARIPPEGRSSPSPPALSTPQKQQHPTAILANVPTSVFLVKHGLLCRSWRSRWPEVTARRAHLRFPGKSSSYCRYPVGLLLCQRRSRSAAPPIHHEQHSDAEHTTVANWSTAKTGGRAVRIHHYNCGT